MKAIGYEYKNHYIVQSPLGVMVQRKEAGEWACLQHNTQGLKRIGLQSTSEAEKWIDGRFKGGGLSVVWGKFDAAAKAQ